MVDVRICSIGDVPDGDSRRFDVAGHRLCVVHIGDDWYVIGDRCSHQDYSLAEGEVWVEDLEVECPKHGSMFSLTTGEALTLPATQPVPVYSVHVDGDDVVVVMEDAEVGDAVTPGGAT